MIMNTAKSIAYVHIPKCAGSMVKSQLTEIDQTRGRYKNIIPHPEFGRVHSAHLPLWLLEKMYPEDFAALKACTSYTVMRDPFDRFRSAMAQRLSEFRGIDIFTLSPKELEQEIDIVVRFLTDNPSNPTVEYVHFLRQVDFIRLNGERVVDHIYRMSAVKSLMQAIEAQIGVSFVYSLKGNQNLNFRMKALKRPVYAANTMIKQMLPVAIYSPLKDMASRILTKSTDDGVKQNILGDQSTRDFIKRHYAEDFELYEKALV